MPPAAAGPAPKENDTSSGDITGSANGDKGAPAWVEERSCCCCCCSWWLCRSMDGHCHSLYMAVAGTDPGVEPALPVRSRVPMAPAEARLRDAAAARLVFPGAAGEAKGDPGARPEAPSMAARTEHDGTKGGVKGEWDEGQWCGATGMALGNSGPGTDDKPAHKGITAQRHTARSDITYKDCPPAPSRTCGCTQEPSSFIYTMYRHIVHKCTWVEVPTCRTCTHLGPYPAACPALPQQHPCCGSAPARP